MTHVAARHSIVTLVSFAFMTALLTLIRLVLFPFFLLAPSDFVSWLIMRIRELSFLFNSRKHELECDVTANFFTQNAGYNPLGAFVLQEIIRERGSLKDFMHKNFEFVFTHPHQDKRMRAIFASIQQLQPQALHGRLKWEIADNGYDFLRTAPGVSYAHRAQEAVPS
jgi:Zn-dependent protease with chaperone function